MVVEIDMTVYCSHPKFRRAPATYKIAAEWTGGDYKELKTYGFANDDCAVDVFAEAARRLRKFRPSEGEHLGELMIFHLEPDRHDYELNRAIDLEEKAREKVQKSSPKPRARRRS